MSSAPSTISPMRALQRRASDPAASVWVSANAGSGKTEVLAQRVIRLMLDDVKPDELLCLTYTKAAAAEMTNRVFERLGSWITLEDADLRARVEALEGKSPDARRLSRARRLFADALETPGGLKIQTIHAFCERLLHLFPFDAKTPAHFEVLDDAAQSQMFDEAIASAVSGGEGVAVAAAFARVAEDAANPDDFRALLKRMLSLRGDDARPDDHEPTDNSVRLASLLGVARDEKADDAARDCFAGGIWAGGWKEIVAALRANASATNEESAASIEEVTKLSPLDAKQNAARALFLKRDGDPKSPVTLMTKKARAAAPAMAEALDAEAARFAAFLDRLAAIEALARNAAMFAVADAVLAHYRAAKGRRGALDFADLIERTRALLANPGVGPWILYKLDSRLSHILVDEAQDTSEAQWDIVARLAEEFTVGAGAREVRRTIFAVGDEKQSIYGFQGAAPKSFAEMRRQFHRRHVEASKPFFPVPLTVSFRSTVEVLSAVDRIFADPQHARGLTFDDTAPPTHSSVRLDARDVGFVELWPLITKTDEPEPEDYLDPGAASAPVDQIAGDSPRGRLARRVAEQARLLIADGDPTGRPVKPGDVMILVRRRGALFDAMISALKQAGVAVAGADRLRVAQHIAVQDALALARAALMPDDDHALACALKSPLVGLDDDDLLAFAPQREGSLSDALAAASPPKLAHAATLIARWRAGATLGPFGFFARLLEAEGGRSRLVARLGAEAGDALDEFLSRALEFEQREGASLAAFIAALEGAEIEIKRDLAQATNEVRVMTVHAAKGLEAPIVILPDTTSRPEGRGAAPALRLASVDGGPPLGVWAPAGSAPAAIRAARNAASADAEDEHRRLLYVALTRARNGLIIAGATGYSAAPAGSWYAQVESALQTGDPVKGEMLASAPARGGEGEVMRWVIAGREQRVGPSRAAAVAMRARALPRWLFEPASAEAPKAPPLSPSRAAEAADRRDRPPDPATDTARARGRFAHRLLEALPDISPAQRADVAAQMASLGPASLPEAERAGLAESALALIADARFAALFGPDSRAEVRVAGPIRLRDRIVQASGAIDRLAVTEGAVWIVDYKTAARPPASTAAIPQTAVSQLAAYRALIAPLYPGRAIRCVIVWTAGPTLHEISNSALDAALDSL